MDSDSEETVSNVSDLDQLRKGFRHSDWLILCPIKELYFSIQSESTLNQFKSNYGLGLCFGTKQR